MLLPAGSLTNFLIGCGGCLSREAHWEMKDREVLKGKRETLGIFKHFANFVSISRDFSVLSSNQLNVSNYYPLLLSLLLRLVILSPFLNLTDCIDFVLTNNCNKKNAHFKTTSQQPMQVINVKLIVFLHDYFSADLKNI